MAKCPECGSRKGKRRCALRDAPICPRCCAALRDAATCEECRFYQPPRRDYNNLPRFSTADMSTSPVLQRLSLPVERALCALDQARAHEMRDAQAVEVLHQYVP